MAPATDGSIGGGRDGERAGEPPAPDGLPLLGNTVGFARDPVGFYDRIGEFEEDVVRYRVAGSSGYALKHPDHVERVLVTEGDRFVRSSVTRDALGQVIDGRGLLLADGETWARQRKLLQPAFYRERIEAYADAMTGIAAETVDAWDDGAVVPVRDEMQRLTLRVLAETLFGVDLDERGGAVGDAAGALLARFDPRSVSAYLPPWVPTPRNRRFRRAIDDLDGLVDELIAERRAAGGDGSADGDDLLSLLVAARERSETAAGGGDGANAGDGDDERLSDREVRANMVTFLIAGHETTSLALTYALYLLATHPDVAGRLRAELAELDGPPGPAGLGDLDVLDRVLSESLRLYPPAYTLFREATEPVVFDGYEIEPDVNLSLPQWIVHRDERWYDDPHEFRPERWSDDLEADLPDFAYYPFGGGPRVCIGGRFATMEAKLALATILPRVELAPVKDDPLDLRMAITLQPGDPVEMRVDRRA